MRKAIFVFILGMLALSLFPFVFSQHDEKKNKDKDTLIAKVSSPKTDKSVIESTCEFFDTIEWSEEEIKKFTSEKNVDGHMTVIEPWILIRGAERELDTFVNYWNIHFTTEE